MEDGLQKLAGEWRGELREKNLAGRVLADFRMIQGLRLQKCPWHRIAGAMGVNPDSLRKLYLWTATEIAAKRLEAPPPTETVTARPAATAAARPTQARTEQQAQAGAISEPTATNTEPGPGEKPARPGWTQIPIDKPLK